MNLREGASAYAAAKALYDALGVMLDNAKCKLTEEAMGANGHGSL